MLNIKMLSRVFNPLFCDSQTKLLFSFPIRIQSALGKRFPCIEIVYKVSAYIIY